MEKDEINPCLENPRGKGYDKKLLLLFLKNSFCRFNTQILVFLIDQILNYMFY